MRFLILGYGRFGQLAFSRLKEAFPSAQFTVADIRRDKLTDLPDRSTRPVAVDVPLGLGRLFADRTPDDWIVPAIPLHAAYEWLQLRLKDRFHTETVDVPDEILMSLPNPIRGDNKACYASIADFMCPDDCPEPDACCSCTGEPRPVVLHDALSNLKHTPFRSVVIVSRQLAPGVGGYRVMDMDAALTEISDCPGAILIATACKCHGVMHALRITPRMLGKDLTIQKYS